MELTQNGVLVSDVNYNTLTYVYTRMHRHTQKHTCTHTRRHVLFSIVIHMAAIRGGNGVGLPSLAAQVVRVGGLELCRDDRGGASQSHTLWC